MKALVFAHYSPHGSLSPAARHALAQYRPHFDAIILVSASPLAGDDLETARRHCDKIIQRQNAGYDFCSWKEGIAALAPLERFDGIVTANDSVIGPLGETDDLFARLWADPRDVCGLTLNWEFERHVQSYFIRFGAAPIRSGALEAFWQSVESLSDKQAIIERYEVGLTRFMEARGHSTGALFEPSSDATLFLRLSLAARNASLMKPAASVRGLRRAMRADHLNPTHYFWREMLENDVPFVKRELIRDNPARQNLAALYREVEKRYGLGAGELGRLAGP